MIFFIVPRQEAEGLERPLEPEWFLEPRSGMPEGVKSEDLCFITWMEVYPTHKMLVEDLVMVALKDPVCRGMLGTLEQVAGLGLLRPRFLNSPKQLERTAALFWEVLSAWCDPRVGNPQSPTPAPQDNPKLVGMWRDFFDLGKESVQAMTEYLKAQKNVYRKSPSPRAQVRAFHNIVDLARAVLGEITTEPVKRLDKLLALKLCQSPKLLERQRLLLSVYWRRHGAAILEKVARKDATMLGTQYLRYYFGATLSKVVDGTPEQVRAALEALMAVALGKSLAPSLAKETQGCVDIFRRLPPTVRSTMLFNDLRKWMEKKEEQTFVRASLVLQGKPETNVQGYPHLWPIDYRAVDPGGNPPIYPPKKPGFLRAWNPDEQAPYAIAYRMNLCPMWAGPSGHTVNALIHWTEALGDEAPEDTAAVVACSLFLFWRLYYDKRVSAAHTLTETFEATLVAAIGGDLRIKSLEEGEEAMVALKREDLRKKSRKEREATLVAALRESLRSKSLKAGFVVEPAPSKKTILQDFEDAYDLVQACALTSGPAKGAIHPIGLVRTMFRALWRSGSFAAYDDLKSRIDDERGRLTGQGYVLQQWSQDRSTESGISVKSYEPSDDEDLRPIPLELGKLAMEQLGEVFEHLRDNDDQLGAGEATWQHHAGLMDVVPSLPKRRARNQRISLQLLAKRLTQLRILLTALATDVEGAFLAWNRGALHAYVPRDTSTRVKRLITQVGQCHTLAGTATVERIVPAIDQLERTLLSLRQSLWLVRLSRTSAIPDDSRALLHTHVSGLKQCWERLRKVLPERHREQPLPLPLSSTVKDVQARAIKFVAHLEPVFSHLSKDLRGKRVGQYFSKESRADIQEVWRNFQEDSVFLQNATQPFRLQGTLTRMSDEAIEVSVRQLVRSLPTGISDTLDSIQEVYSRPETEKSLRKELGIYLSKLRGLLLEARRVGEDLRPSTLDLPEQRLKPPRALLTRDPPPLQSKPVVSGSSGPSSSKSSKGSKVQVERPSSTHSSLSFLPHFVDDDEEDTHWYSGREIRVLLRLYLRAQRDRVYLMEGIDAHLHLGQTLTDNLADATLAIIDTAVEAILLPVHVGGNHWTALSIHFDLTHVAPYLAPTIVYVDPQGTRDMPPSLRRTLAAQYPQATFAPRSTRAYQVRGDGHNCGPWTVALLQYLATHNGALPAIDAIRIAQRRRDDSRHLQRAL